MNDQISAALAYMATPEFRDRVAETTARQHAHGVTGTEIRKKRLRAAIKAGTHSADQWVAICRHYGHACLKCGKRQCHLDHVQPISLGGSDHATNLQPLCKTCNSSKGAGTTDYRPDHGRWARERFGEADCRAD